MKGRNFSRCLEYLVLSPRCPLREQDTERQYKDGYFQAINRIVVLPHTTLHVSLETGMYLATVDSYTPFYYTSFPSSPADSLCYLHLLRHTSPRHIKLVPASATLHIRRVVFTTTFSGNYQFADQIGWPRARASRHESCRKCATHLLRRDRGSVRRHRGGARTSRLRP